MSDGKIKIDASLENSVDRTQRSVVLAVAEVFQKLESLGWRPSSMTTFFPDDGEVVVQVLLRKKVVFEIKKLSSKNTIELQGTWLEEPKKPSVIEKFMNKY